MKKVFMMMAFAAFFSMAATSCAGEEATEEGETTEAEAEGEEAEEEGH